MQADKENTQIKIQELLGQEIVHFSLKAAGYCNNAYYVETRQGGRYIVKLERVDKELTEQNTLPIEGELIKKLAGLNLSLPLPKVTFISELPAMYGYEYIEGERLIEVWQKLTEEERIGICHSLGNFHAEIGERFSRSDAIASGLTIDESPNLHPEVAKEYEIILARNDVPDGWEILAQRARAIFEQTMGRVIFQFMHNDAHHENVLIKDKQIAGIIDFGDAEYGEVAGEFSRYIRDYPRYFEYIVATYEKVSGHELSRARLISNAFLSGLIDNVEDYTKGGESRNQAVTAVATYRELFESLI